MIDLEAYLYELFGEEEGYVYTPYQNISGDFHKEWYYWPGDKEDLLEILPEDNITFNQYISPVLYSDTKFTFKLSNVVWADFDETPNLAAFAYHKPKMVVYSGKGQHWYWKLTTPIREQEQLEDYNRRISRAFDADKVAWNYNRILRPPGTLNHKYDPPRKVSFFYTNQDSVDPFTFEELPEVPRVSNSEETTWVPEDYSEQFLALRNPLQEFINQDTPQHRAQALFSIAKSLNELGWNRNKVLTLLSYTAGRWGKWSGRADRNERLCSLYGSVVGATVEETKKVSTLLPTKKVSEILSSKYQVDWILEGLLKSKGFIIVAAAPGVGKTTLAMNLMFALATGTKFLDWEVTKKRKTLFMSLEMDEEGLQIFMGRMAKEYPDNLDDIDENIDIHNSFHFRLQSEENREKLLATLDALKPDGIVFDSLSRISGDINAKDSIDEAFDFIAEEIITKRGMFVIIIHHEGKGSSQGDQRNGLDKVYGSVFITAWVDTVVRLQKIGNYGNRGIKFTIEKGRYDGYLEPIDAYRNENLILRPEESYIK